MSPRQVGLAYGLLCGVVLAISLAFAWRGIWFVFGFGLLEIGALGVALLYYARHATDQEHIALNEHGLLVERIEGGQRQHIGVDCANRCLEFVPVKPDAFVDRIV